MRLSVQLRELESTANAVRRRAVLLELKSFITTHSMRLMLSESKLGAELARIEMDRLEGEGWRLKWVKDP